MISNCIFTWGFTSKNYWKWTTLQLWIDFKLYFYVRIHKNGRSDKSIRAVVNWFQIVFLREDSQVHFNVFMVSFCCELISNCIFTWGFTSLEVLRLTLKYLWIDFKLYFYVRIHKFIVFLSLSSLVVNWFQIVFLREDSQGLLDLKFLNSCCELISNCIFTWGFTRSNPNPNCSSVLWIDFKLYFYVRIHKCIYTNIIVIIVVNWFQIVFLREDSQE